MAKTDLFSLTFDELRSVISAEGYPAYRATQVFSWIYGRGESDPSRMTNLPKDLRAWLGQALRIPPITVGSVRTSGLDATKKLLVRLGDGLAVETVIMPDRAKATVCVSTQVGCALGCAFCATGKMGLLRSLTAGEIAGQVLAACSILDVAAAVSRVNVVFMGMGEPLANCPNVFKAIEILNDARGLAVGARRITVSTAGLPAGIRRLSALGLQTGLAISLNAADDSLRSRLMPINKRYPIRQLIAAAAAYASKVGRRVTLEYVLLGGVNDRRKDAVALSAIGRDLPCKINIIEYNISPGLPFRPPTPASLARFVGYLYDHAPAVMVRRSRGSDIAAACGQLYVESAGKGARPRSGGASYGAGRRGSRRGNRGPSRHDSPGGKSGAGPRGSAGERSGAGASGPAAKRKPSP